MRPLKLSYNKITIALLGVVFTAAADLAMADTLWLKSENGAEGEIVGEISPGLFQVRTALGDQFIKADRKMSVELRPSSVNRLSPQTPQVPAAVTPEENAVFKEAPRVAQASGVGIPPPEAKITTERIPQVSPSSVVGAPPTEAKTTPKPVKLSLKNFLKGVNGLEQHISKKTNQYDLDINQAIAKGDNPAAMKLVLEETQMISQGLMQVDAATVPEEGAQLKESMIRYYQSMLAVEAAMLKYLVDTPGGVQLVESSIQEMTRHEEQFQKEFKRVQQACGEPGTSAATEKMFSGSDYSRGEEILAQLREQNDQLVEETRELIRANQELQGQTRVLIEQNKRIKENMVAVIRSAISNASKVDKAELRRYFDAM